MKTRHWIQSWVGLGLVVVAALVLVFVPSQAGAVTCPTASTADTDGDGFSDTVECAATNPFAGTAGGTFPTCGGGLARAACLDPNTPDLFIILVPASGSLLPPNPLEFVSQLKSLAGVTVVPHQITASQANDSRVVFTSSTQKAVKVTEDNTSPTGDFGTSTQGTPNGIDAVKVFTQRIKTFITNVCGTTTCTVSGVTLPANTAANVIAYHIKHTIAHEVGHVTLNKRTSVDRYNGYHDPQSSGVMMEMNTSYKGTTFSIGGVYASNDSACLKSANTSVNPNVCQ